MLCNSALRCEDVTTFCSELVQYCPQMLEIINLNSDDFSDELIKLKELSKEDDLAIKSKVLVSTPGTVLKLIENGFFDGQRRMFNLIADKVDLLQALDFTDEMVEIGNFIQKASNGPAKIVVTTTVLDEKAQTSEDQDAFKQIKKSL